MKRSKGIIAVLLAASLAGCHPLTDQEQTAGQKEGDPALAEEYTQTDPSEEQTADTSEEQEQTETAEDGYQDLSLEAVEELAAKHDALTLDDFAPYMDISQDLLAEGICEDLEFTYNGKTYYLRVIASDKSDIQTPYQGSLDAAMIFSEDFLKLSTREEEYLYEGSCADIRSGVLEHILEGTVTMEDYLTCELPEGVTQSSFKYWMASRGGVVFLKEGQSEEELVWENTGMTASIDRENPLCGGIEIWGNGDISQHMEVLTEWDPLPAGEDTIWRGEVQMDDGYTWYAAFIKREDSTIAYGIYLNAELYTEEEFFALADTIQLKPYAIY